MPIVARVPATRFGDVTRASGQLPLIDGALPAEGKVDSDIPAEDARGLTRVAVLNALAAAAALAGGLDGLSRIVHVTVFISSAPDFTGQAAVANGTSEVLGEIFGEVRRHPHSAVDIAVLPLNIPVEVEAQLATVREPQLREGRVDGSTV